MRGVLGKRTPSFFLSWFCGCIHGRGSAVSCNTEGLVCMYVCTYVCMYVCTYVCLSIYIYNIVIFIFLVLLKRPRSPLVIIAARIV